MNSLPFARFRFNFLVETPLQLNFYSGSMLRGAFGHALRFLSCMTKMPDCKTCMLYQTCPYPLVFEHPPQTCGFQDFSQIPNPYIIEPPPLGHKLYQSGEVLTFNMVLIGSAISQLALIIYAWQRALAFGVGKEKGTARLLTVIAEPNQVNEQVIFDTALNSAVQPFQAVQPLPFMEKEEIRLQFVTPLQIKRQGKIIRDEMTARDILMALVRRYYLLAEFYGRDYVAPDFKALTVQAEAVSLAAALKSCNWQRFSNRQQQLMQFNGCVGEMVLRGDLQPFLNLLQAGQWLHIGNKTTFGMGQYVLNPR